MLATVGVFLLAMTGHFIVFAAAEYLLSSYLHLNFLTRGGLLGAIAILNSALIAGSFYFNRARSRPTGAQSWWLAFYFAVCTLILGVARFAVVMLAIGASKALFDGLQAFALYSSAMRQELPVFLFGLLLAVLVFTLVARLGLSIGLWRSGKAYEKRRMLADQQFA